MSWDQYSQTPASNDLSGYFQTGMAPSKVKNAGWDIMADLSQFMSLPTSAGTANAQTITNIRQFGALFTGMWAVFVPGFTNTGSMTLAVDGLAAKNVFCNGAAALAGQVVSGIPAYCRYDGTQWQLVNPQRSTGSFTITLTGMTGVTTGAVNYAILSDGKTANIWVVVNITGTSNATTMTGTGVPSILVASNGGVLYMLVEDSGSLQIGQVDTITNTTWTFYKGTAYSGAWTNTGVKGLPASCRFNYSL